MNKLNHVCKGTPSECSTFENHCTWPNCQVYDNEPELEVWFVAKTRRGPVNVLVSDSIGITVDHSDRCPYCYYDDQEGITSANNPAFWYSIGMLKPNYPVPAIPIEIEYLNGAVMVCEMNNPAYRFGIITLYPN